LSTFFVDIYFGAYGENFCVISYFSIEFDEQEDFILQIKDAKGTQELKWIQNHVKKTMSS